jgi:hypothetical protein
MSETLDVELNDHLWFIHDVRRFGSSFMDACPPDDFQFSNFQGLRRPEHMEIGGSVLRQPDIDVELQSNKPFSFT